MDIWAIINGKAHLSMRLTELFFDNTYLSRFSLESILYHECIPRRSAKHKMRRECFGCDVFPIRLNCRFQAC